MTRPADLDVLARLEAVIAARRGADPDASHTARMLAQGPTKCAQKFGEEAVETVIAGAAQDDDALASEAADALYHLLVLLAARDIPLADVMAELARREGVSGVAEKAGRPQA
ncbi:MAG: phosphoribosyl-ATP diphosphatase [Pseudomonadota bacterium]